MQSSRQYIDLRQLGVLVLDDNANTRTLISEVLLGLGVTRVYRAGACAQALSILDTHRIDIILADIEIDGEDGLAFVRRLRDSANAGLASIPVVIISSHATEARVMEAGAIGANGFLSKPFTVGAFAKRLTDAIAGRRMPASLPAASGRGAASPPPLQIEL
jgi:two-component system, chemotaxis family, chemotaxis protein CheY